MGTEIANLRISGNPNFGALSSNQLLLPPHGFLTTVLGVVRRYRDILLDHEKS